MPIEVKNQLKTSFHRTFPLQRAPLAEYLRALADAGKSLSFDEVRAVTSLGTVKVESMRRYARATGLTNTRDGLSPLGHVVVADDPYLNALASTWLLHAAMITEDSAAPPFWKVCWDSARLGEVIDRSTVSRWVEGCESSERVNLKTAEEAATVFMTSYSKAECLGDIGLLAKTSKGYEVQHLRTGPPIGVVSWFVAVQWDAIFPGQLSVDLDEFKRKTNLAAAFKLSPQNCDDILRTMADMHVCELYLSAPPFQVVRSWGSSEELARGVYESR